MARWPSQTELAKGENLGCTCVPSKQVQLWVLRWRLRKGWGPGLLLPEPNPSPDRHFSFPLLPVPSNHTTLSLFRWQLHSKRWLSHPSAGSGCSSDFKAHSKVFSQQLFCWEHSDKLLPLLCQALIKSPVTQELLQSSPRDYKGRRTDALQIPGILWCLAGLSALFLPLSWTSSRHSEFTLDLLQIKWQYNSWCVSVLWFETP